MLLERWRGGESEALEALVAVVYDELRRLAGRQLRRERIDHTLQPTSLVNEAFLRLLGGSSVHPNDRVHFFALAARTMRQVLVDHARRRAAGKRIIAEPLEGQAEPGVAPASSDVLALHQALERLAVLDPRQAQVVELRHFGGLENQEIAAVLGISLATVERDWRIARLWLHRELSR